MSIFSSKIKQKGFTLVEILASVITLVAIGSVITGIISSSLRGSNKTNTIENIRQNGSYVLSQISKDIEYAQPFDGKNTGLSNDDGKTYYTTCPPFSPSPTPLPVATTYKLIAVKSMSNKITKYRCSSNPSVLSSDSVALVNANLLSLKNCSIICVKSRLTDVPIIKIIFSIEQKKINVFAENSSSPITFETSIVMKNYRQ
jgi:type II secretory pathway pseudopilin PulG